MKQNKSCFLLVAALAMSFISTAEADSWKDKLKNLKDKVIQKDDDAATSIEAPDVEPYQPFSWGDDLFAVMKKLCEMDEIKTIALAGLQTSSIRSKKFNTDDFISLPYDDDFATYAVFEKADVCFVSDLQNKVMPYPGFIYELEDQQVVLGKHVGIIATPKAIAGLGFELQFKFGQEPDTWGSVTDHAVSLGFFLERLESEQPIVSSRYTRANWDKTVAKKKPPASLSRAVEACNSRSEKFSKKLREFSQSMGNTVSDEEFRKALKSNQEACNCTYAKFGEQSGANSYAQDFYRIEKFLEGEISNMATETVLTPLMQEARRVKLQMTLDSEASLLAYFNASLGCPEETIENLEDIKLERMDVNYPGENGKDVSPAYETDYVLSFPLTNVSLIGNCTDISGEQALQSSNLIAQALEEKFGKYELKKTSQGSRTPYRDKKLRSQKITLAWWNQESDAPGYSIYRGTIGALVSRDWDYTPGVRSYSYELVSHKQSENNCPNVFYRVQPKVAKARKGALDDYRNSQVNVNTEGVDDL